MNTVILKEKLHQYIDDSDDTLLKIMYAIAKEYNEHDSIDDSDVILLDARREKRLSGESKLYSWAEAKQIITAKE
jgi:ribosome biogenesis SPOUT family RNA methylase Rps3